MDRRTPEYWVPNKRKPEVGERLEPVKTAVSHKGSCLFVIDENGHPCGEPVYNNCHVIPQSAVLGQIKDKVSGKVLDLRWGIRRWEHLFVSSSEANPIDLNATDAFDPQPVGTGDACVRWFACKDHDNEFSPIDIEELDLDDPIVRFLCIYRATLYVADIARLGKRLLKDWDKPIMRNGLPQQRSQWVQDRGTLKTGTPSAQYTATRLGKVWYDWKTRGGLDTDFVSGQLLPFRSRLKFAACAPYGQDLYVVVFPVSEDRHKLGILHLAEHSDSVAEETETLTQICRASEGNHDYGVDVLKGIMAKEYGTVAASPDSYRGLSEQERQEIRQIVAHNSAAGRMAKSFPSQPPQPKGWRYRRR